MYRSCIKELDPREIRKKWEESLISIVPTYQKTPKAPSDPIFHKIHASETKKKRETMQGAKAPQRCHKTTAASVSANRKRTLRHLEADGGISKVHKMRRGIVTCDCASRGSVPTPWPLRVVLETVAPPQPARARPKEQKVATHELKKVARAAMPQTGQQARRRGQQCRGSALTLWPPQGQPKPVASSRPA